MLSLVKYIESTFTSGGFMIKIALTCSHEDARYFLKSRYVNYILLGGRELKIDVLPVILPHSREIITRDLLREYVRVFDGFIFTGGGDIFPQYYTSDDLGVSADIDTVRDEFEMSLLEEIKEADKAVLGICRGIQIMAASMGGTLWQDIEAECSQNHPAEKSSSPKHSVKLFGSAREIFGCDEMITNSFHHQAVRSPGRDMKISAVSSDGIIEMISNEDMRFFRAVQWHPEIAPDENSVKLIKSFLSSAV